MRLGEAPNLAERRQLRELAPHLFRGGDNLSRGGSGASERCPGTTSGTRLQAVERIQCGNLRRFSNRSNEKILEKLGKVPAEREQHATSGLELPV